MKKNLLKYDLFVEKHLNEDLASKNFDYDENGAEEKIIDEVQNNDEEDYTDEFNQIEKKENKDKEISKIQEKLEDYEPPFEYIDIVLDSETERVGIIDTIVWIEFLGVDDINSLDFELLEEDFIKKTDFDEVEVMNTENSVSFFINIYDWDNR